MGCARTDFYYPSDGKATVVDEHGHVSRPHNRAIVLNGSDSLGATHVKITGNSLEFDNQGGNRQFHFRPKPAIEQCDTALARRPR
jgi:hypothetical protein